MLSPNNLRLVVLLAFFFLMILGFKRKIWAVVAYMILVYCKLSNYYPSLSSFQAELVFGLLILLWLILRSRAVIKLSIEYDLVNRYLFFFVMCIFLSFTVAWNHQSSWDNKIYHFIKVLLLYIMTLLAIEDERDIKLFVWSFLVMFTYLAYEPMYGFITKTGGELHLYGDIYVSEHGILGGHVALANNMNQMLPIAFFLIPACKNKASKIMLIGIICILGIALVGSKSRGGVVGFAFFAVIVVYFSKNRLRNTVIAGVIVVAMLMFTSMQATADRIGSDSIYGRLTGLTHGIEMLRRGNLLGVGPGCFLFARGEYFGYTMESHNIYGQMIGDLGIPGTVAWFFFIRQVFCNLSEAKRKLRKLSMDNEFLYRLALGIQASLMVRLFISLATHGLYYFYWYVLAVLSIFILKMSMQMELPKNTNSSQKISVNL